MVQLQKAVRATTCTTTSPRGSCQRSSRVPEDKSGSELPGGQEATHHPDQKAREGKCDGHEEEKVREGLGAVMGFRCVLGQIMGRRIIDSVGSCHHIYEEELNHYTTHLVNQFALFCKGM